MFPEVKTLSSLLGLLMLWFPLDSQARARPGKVCIFGEKIYTPGQSWHPYLEPQGLMYCVRCTCTESGHVNCYRLRCPPIHCSQPVIEPQQCCPRCVDLQAPSGLRAPSKSCQYNETTYQHGEIFSAQELLPAHLSNQCVLCSCIEGQIYCGLMTCPEPGCPTSLPPPDSCCQISKDRASESSAEENSTQLQLGEVSVKLCSYIDIPIFWSFSLIILKEKHKKACTHNGKTYSHGEVWHPTILSFGPMPCILCTCEDGYQDCHRVTCPTQYPCSHPKKVAGKCCKVCPEDEAHPGHSEVISTRCPKVPGQIHVYTLVSPSPDSLHRFVLEHEASDQVEIYLWKLVKGIFHLVQIKRVKKQDFQKEAQNFRLLTGTHEGYWINFLAQTAELKVTASPDKVTKTL
uniref:Chordin-like 2 n=1 Tax=Nannospalax galili TaxID=1026970 RepID=A0A8C6QAJ2_NANGA